MTLLILIAEPLPMKLRALPQSFWQQPNNMLCQETLGTICPALPIISKEEIAECLTTGKPYKKSFAEISYRNLNIKY